MRARIAILETAFGVESLRQRSYTNMDGETSPQ